MKKTFSLAISLVLSLPVSYAMAAKKIKVPSRAGPYTATVSPAGAKGFSEIDVKAKTLLNQGSKEAHADEYFVAYADRDTKKIHTGAYHPDLKTHLIATLDAPELSASKKVEIKDVSPTRETFAVNYTTEQGLPGNRTVSVNRNEVVAKDPQNPGVYIQQTDRHSRLIRDASNGSAGPIKKGLQVSRSYVNSDLRTLRLTMHENGQRHVGYVKLPDSIQGQIYRVIANTDLQSISVVMSDGTLRRLRLKKNLDDQSTSAFHDDVTIDFNDPRNTVEPFDLKKLHVKAELHKPKLTRGQAKAGSIEKLDAIDGAAAK